MINKFIVSLLVSFISLTFQFNGTSDGNLTIVAVNLRYKSDAKFYCNQNGIPGNQWQNVAFYKTYIPFEQINLFNDSSSFINNISSYLSYINYDKRNVFDPSQNLLTIKNLVREDTQPTYLCKSNNQTILFKSQIQPFLYVSESLTYIVIEGGSSKINCKALYGYEKNQTLIWTWYKDNYPVASIDNLNIQNDDARHESTIEIKNAIKQNEGYYKCVVANSYGDFSRTMRFRVKDRLAPLWPFFGILGQVILLIAILFSCHKYKQFQKAKQNKD